MDKTKRPRYEESTGEVSDGDKLKITLELDTSALDAAQKKADKLKETLTEVQELIRKTEKISIKIGAKEITDAVIAKVTEAVEKSATYCTTREFCIGIEGYSTHTTPQKNVMTVDFAIIGTAMEPKDYQAILDRLQTFCEEFTKASRHPNG